MRKFENIFAYGGWIGLVICLVFLFFLNRENSQPAPINTIEKSTIYVYDSTKKVLIPTFNPVSVSIQTVSVPASVDTSKILQSFFAIHTYSDQIQDSLYRLQIFDTVSQNKIYGRRAFIQTLRPVKIIESSTVNVVKDCSGLYAGAFTIGNKNQFGFGPSLTWLTKNKVAVSYGYDVINNNHQVGAQFLLWKK